MPKCDLNTRYIPATLAWTLLLGTTALFFYYPCHWYLLRHPWVPAYQGVITFFVLANFTLATFMDPGVIPKAPPDEDREDDFRAPLYKSVEINGITVRMKWCVTCKFYRPPRCSHCSVCNHCIETFDHHCPWVNNCIGRRNYRFFFFFLISLSIHMLSIFGLSLFFVMNIGTNINAVEPIVSMAIMGVIALLAIPIFGLAGFHMVLVSRGRTTNEQVTGKFTGGFNPFSRGCWNNCCYTQFGPHFPSLKKPQRYLYKPSKKQQRRAIPPAANGGAGERVETAVSTIEHHHVKTYTADNNGGVQHAHYNKLLANNRNNDLESSVSADCEPTPPSRRPPAHYPRLSPATQGYRVVLDGTVNGTLTSGGPTMVPMAMMPQQLHMGGARPSPTAAARVRALGIPTPLTLGSPVRRSNPGTPTASRRPDALAARRTFLSEGELLSSQPIPKATVSPAAWNDPARPVSFTRALDIHNALSPPQTHSGGPTPERASLYDCNNYEISVFLLEDCYGPVTFNIIRAPPLHHKDNLFV